MIAVTKCRRTGAGRFGHYLDRLVEVARRKGWIAAASRICASLRWRISPAGIAMRSVARENEGFDALHGTDTCGEVPLEQAGIDAAEVEQGNGIYRAIPTSYFNAALALLKPGLEGYTFLDYGSGKGKALLLASAHRFWTIIGVEYSPALHQIACSNLRGYASPGVRCESVQSLHADARHYEPPDDPLVCFFFNPFDASVWRAVLTRLQLSFDRNPRPIHIVYVNIRDVAELEDIFPEFPIFTPMAATKTVRILTAIPKPVAAA